MQDEVEKRRQRARKFGTTLVQDGLQPALTAVQAAKAEAMQDAKRTSEAVHAKPELTDAGELALLYTVCLPHGLPTFTKAVGDAQELQ